MPVLEAPFLEVPAEELVPLAPCVLEAIEALDELHDPSLLGRLDPLGRFHQLRNLQGGLKVRTLDVHHGHDVAATCHLG